MDPPYYTSPTEDHSIQLPTEMLLDIFKYTLVLEEDLWSQDLNSRSSFFIAQTCRRWRALSLSSSRLWSQIYIHWPCSLAFLYFQRAGSIAQLSFIVNEEALDSVADAFDTDRLYESDDDSDYVPESDASSDYSDVDSEGSIAEDEAIEGEEVLRLSQSANADSALTDTRILSTDQDEYDNPDETSDDRELDEDESTATVALLLAGLRSSAAAILFVPGIRRRIKSVHFDRRRSQSYPLEEFEFAEEILLSVWYFFYHNDFPSLQAWGLETDWEALDTWDPLSKELLPRLRQLVISNIQLETPLFVAAIPIVSLELHCVTFHGFSGELAANLHILLSTLPSLEDLTLTDIKINTHPSLLATSADDVPSVELPFLKTLVIALDHPHIVPVLKGLRVPTITKIDCWPLQIAQLASNAIDSESPLIELIASIFGTLNLLLSAPSSYFSLLSINSLPRHDGWDFVFAPSSGTSSLKILFDYGRPRVTTSHLVAFVAQFISLIPTSVAIRRLVLRPFPFLRDSAYGSAWLLPFIKSLQAVETIELSEFPDGLVQSALLDMEEHTLAKIIRS